MTSYDPLRSSHAPAGNGHAPSYWAATAGTPPEDDGPLTADTDCDVVIVGAGYTGLSAALHLARDHGIAASVLEAGRWPGGAADAMAVSRGSAGGA